MYKRQVQDSDGGSDDDPLTSADESALLERGTMGPRGVRSLFSREVIMRPVLGEAVDTVRFGDEWTISQHYSNPPASETHFILPICHRYEATMGVNSSYNVNYGASDSEVGRSLNMLTAADMQRIKAIIKDDTGRLGDVMRTILFGGDTRIEQATLKGSTIKATAKVWCSIQTPYSLDIS